MAKKTADFTSKEELDAFKEAISTENTNNTKNTIATKGRPATTETEASKDDYRFNARFTAFQGKYIQERAWQMRKSITATLQFIIEEDMKQHPEIVEAIDDLNG